MNLRQYLENRGMKIKFFAELMGTSSPHVSQWMSGKKVPRKETMKEIERITKGKVKPGDWFTE